MATDDELDALVVEYLSNLSQVLSLYHHLEDSLSLGRFSLAKTRHNLSGNGSRISSTAYNVHEMSTRGATLKIVTYDKKINSEDDDTLIESIPQFQISDDLLVDGVHTDPSADPIRWFAGVLVPSSLRRAQSSFRRALHLIVNLINQRTILEASGRKLHSMVEARQKQDAANVSSVDPATVTNGN
ncbi:hypothetical protein AHF37_08103 [Paragonimus kellicotti]|nr:hypothetical protein AHF37_08103 [Paragonimus kellicotti]